MFLLEFCCSTVVSAFSGLAVGMIDQAGISDSDGGLPAKGAAASSATPCGTMGKWIERCGLSRVAASLLSLLL